MWGKNSFRERNYKQIEYVVILICNTRYMSWVTESIGTNHLQAGTTDSNAGPQFYCIQWVMLLFSSNESSHRISNYKVLQNFCIL